MASPSALPSPLEALLKQSAIDIIQEDDLTYEQFFADFGPVNLAKVVRFSRRVQDAMVKAKGGGSQQQQQQQQQPVMVVVYCPQHAHRQANAAFLLGAYTMLYHRKTAIEAYAPFLNLMPPLSGFRDAAFDVCTYRLSVLDCLAALERAMALGHFSLNSFDLVSYEDMDLIENGDMNWIIPNKFLAFSGPLSRRRELQPGKFTLLPEEYATEFKRMGISAVVRFNEKCYDRKKFTEVGIRHHELYYEDGANPPDHIMVKFIEICEKEKGGIAVHCKAGLGRTGTNIAAYMIKNYRYTSKEAIAWCRICRPGCVVGQQQAFVQALEPRFLWLRERQQGSKTPQGHRRTTSRSSAGRSSDLAASGTVSKWSSSARSPFLDTMTLEDEDDQEGKDRKAPSTGDGIATRQFAPATTSTAMQATTTRARLAAALAASERTPSQHQPLMTDQRDMISSGYELSDESEGGRCNGSAMTRSSGVVGIHSMAVQARSRRKSLQKQQTQAGKTTHATRRGTARPSSTSAISTSVSLARSRGRQHHHHHRRQSSGSGGSGSSGGEVLMVLTRTGTLMTDNGSGETAGLKTKTSGQQQPSRVRAPPA